MDDNMYGEGYKQIYQMDPEDANLTNSGACCNKKTFIIVTLAIVVLAGASACGVYFSAYGFKIPTFSEPNCPLGYGYNQTLGECVNKYEDDFEDDGFEEMVHFEKTWTTNLILYSFANSKEFSFTATEKSEIRKNMDIIIMNLAPACLEFMELDSDEKVSDYMELQKHGQNCRAHVGRKDKGKTEIQLGAECFDHEGTILHELMHIIGVYHEMNRPDRDLFLDVDTMKINPKNIKEFRLTNSSKYDLSNVTPFDVYSIMNYHEGQACRKGQICMKVKDIFKNKFKNKDGYPLQNSITKMSATDIVDISRKYNCEVQPDTQMEYVKYALDMTETLLKYADQKDCSADSDDIWCKSLRFEAYIYLNDIEGEWSTDYDHKMRDQFCQMYEKKIQNPGKIRNLAKWFTYHEKNITEYILTHKD